MKTAFQVTLILHAMLFFLACDQDTDVNTDIFNTWEAKQFISVESAIYRKNDENAILLFINKNKSYGLQLDINRCGGNLEQISGNQIKFGPAICTEACCDSDFSVKLAEMLPRVTTYKIKGKYLQLFVPGWGSIEFESVKTN